MDRDRYLHKFDLPAPPVPVLQRPLASSTPVYGHDYAQEGQGEDAPFQLHSSWEGMAKSPAGLPQPESDNVPDSDESLGSLQEQPFEDDPLLFPETPVRRKKQSPMTEKRNPSGSRSAAGDTGNEHVDRGNERVERGNERVERERVPPKCYHY